MFPKSYLFCFFVISIYYKFSKAAYLWSRSCCTLCRKSGKIQMVDEAKIDVIMMLIKSYSVKKKESEKYHLLPMKLVILFPI